ncbi:MAG: stage II sporulation protein M [Saprospiraceae bacterium]
MTESQFIEKNKKYWQELENILERKDNDPDKLHNLFVKVSGDLAYASTFYPKRSVRAYLNQLTQKVFDSMESKKTVWSIVPIKRFFSEILLKEVYRSRKAFVFSFVIFAIAVLIGIVSSANNPDFLRVILGDSYVEMTDTNINEGDPMAVYKGSEQSDMFFGITINNIRVAFLAFVLGLFGTLGTIILLMHNGIMLGAFQYYFYSKGLFITSFFTIWIHGTIEISAIIIAGAAGIILGNGLLFPKTYDRGTSIQMASKRAVRIVTSTIPLFVIAGFLESFVTRLTDIPFFAKALIILISLAMILYMYVYYPWYYNKYIDDTPIDDQSNPTNDKPYQYEEFRKRTLGQSIQNSLSQFRAFMGQYYKHALSKIFIVFIIGITFYQLFLAEIINYDKNDIVLLSYKHGGFFLFTLFALGIAYAYMIIIMIYNKIKLTSKNKMIQLKYVFPSTLLIILLPFSVFYFVGNLWIIVLLLVLPPHYISALIQKISKNGTGSWPSLSKEYSRAGYSWIIAIIGFSIILFFHLTLTFSIIGSLGSFFFDFISWHDIFSGHNVTHVLIMTTVHLFIFFFILPMYIYLMLNIYYSSWAAHDAIDLQKRFEGFGEKSTIFES